jgi:hypothetical protein
MICVEDIHKIAFRKVIGMKIIIIDFISGIKLIYLYILAIKEFLFLQKVTLKYLI